MKNILSMIAVSVMLTGCATVQNWIPSFWDDNQSHYIVSARLQVEKIDCASPQAPQVERVLDQLRQFELYSQAKGSLQKDVLRVIEPMQSTVKEWSQRGEGSKTYCELKKKLLTQQGERASKVILGRW
jgi:hypothetical protein